MKQRLLITNQFIPEVIDEAKKNFNVTVLYAPKSEELVSALPGHDAVMCRSATKFTRPVVEAAKNAGIKIIATGTSGTDHIDLSAAREFGITVTNTPFDVTVANAEFNIGAMIAASRNFLKMDTLMRKGVWDQQQILGSEISGKAVGIIGFGRIGILTSRYARALGTRVSAYDPYQKAGKFHEEHVESSTLEELMRSSDFIAINVPLNDETRDMISKKEIGYMKKTAFLIQVSRGSVVNEEALIEALEQKNIAGAVVDVFSTEPTIDPRFFALDNVQLSPHVACSTIETRRRAGMHALSELVRFFKGETPDYLVVGGALEEKHGALYESISQTLEYLHLPPLGSENGVRAFIRNSLHRLADRM